MARKKEISYFTDLSTEEDFEKFLEQDALILLDVYQELLGPCSVGMHGSIEKIKISLTQSDALQLGAANATKIDKLKRFRGKSMPTMLFCRNGKCVDIVYGADIPSVARKVQKHLSMKEFGDNDKTGRYFFEFDEMVPDERAEYERIKAIEDEKYRIRHEAEMIEKKAELDEVILLMKQKAPDNGVTLFMPHVAETAQKKTHENAKWCSLVNRAHKMFVLTPELYEILSYKLDNSLEEKILNYVYNKTVLAILWSTGLRSPMTKVLRNFIESITQPQPVEDEDGNQIPDVFKPALLNPLHIDSNGEIIEMESKDEQLEETSDEGGEEIENEEGGHVKSQDAQRETQNIIQEELTVIPPAWTPSNQPGNAVFMYILFRNHFESFIPSEGKVQEPHLCMILSAKKYEQAFEIIPQYPKTDMMAYGYFTGEDFDSFKLICKTTECYEKYSKKQNTDKLIMKIALDSQLPLALSSLGPLYLSLSPEDAAEESSKIFDEKFEAHHDVIETKKHSKKERE